MNFNLDNNLSNHDKKLINKNIIEPIVLKLAKANNFIKEKIAKLNLEKDKEEQLYQKFKLNIKDLEVKIDKNNLVKII